MFSLQAAPAWDPSLVDGSFQSVFQAPSPSAPELEKGGDSESSSDDDPLSGASAPTLSPGESFLLSSEGLQETSVNGAARVAFIKLDNLEHILPGMGSFDCTGRRQ